MKYLKYLWYVIRHKYFVFMECVKEGIVWRGIAHDLSKLRPAEFFPYANFFYGNNKPKRDKTGYYKPTDTGDISFNFAWLLHQKRNRHHWQWWVLPEDEGGLKILAMPGNDIREMICDWKGASRAQGHKSGTVPEWYKANKHKMSLHRRTRWLVEELLIRMEA
ncbi:hypothetical protein LCGC14_1715570 [marine sediment metagenome]|uniref:Uncharacterized protein n=1 Tax=marine sediment metagenome TaxID=412755 RepID=A0A0F9JUH2_9ZZZZ